MFREFLQFLEEGSDKELGPKSGKIDRFGKFCKRKRIYHFVLNESTTVCEECVAGMILFEVRATPK